MNSQDIISPPQTQSQSATHPNSRVVDMLKLASSPSKVIVAPDEDILSPTSNDPETQPSIHPNPKVVGILRAASPSPEIATTMHGGSLTPNRTMENIEFKKYIQGLQENDKYNITVTCKGAKFETTADVLALHSSYHRASIPLTSNEIYIVSLDHKELFVVERFMDFVYQWDYGPRHRYTNPAANEPPSDLHIHVDMYKLAEEWGVPKLKLKAKRHFDCELTSVVTTSDIDELLDVVPLLYESSGQDLNELQESLVRVWAGLNTQQVESLDQTRLKEVFGKFSDFSVDLVVFHSRAVTPKAPRKRIWSEDSLTEESPSSPTS